MRERGTGILDYKKGTRYLKSSGILLREQSVDPASLYAAASAVAGMFGLSKKEELAERLCQAAYDGAYREAYLLILLLYWNKVQHKCGEMWWKPSSIAEKKNRK